MFPKSLEFFFHRLNIAPVGFIGVQIFHFHGIFLEIKEFPGVKSIVGKTDELLFAIRYAVMNRNPVSTCFIVMIVMCDSPVFRSITLEKRK